jgi:uncharacterized alkaline shock family protein YloU
MSSQTGESSSTTMPSPSSDLVTSQGKTTIADAVVQKIAGVSAREVSGVHKLGVSTARAFGAIRERIPGSSGPNVSQGVTVEVGERQAAVDLDIVVEYGVAIVDVAAAIRRNVIGSLQKMTGLEVTEVNVSVDDIYIPGDEKQESTEPSRVQ